jgi:hypothetical protein
VLKTVRPLAAGPREELHERSSTEEANRAVSRTVFIIDFGRR